MPRAMPPSRGPGPPRTGRRRLARAGHASHGSGSGNRFGTGIAPFRAFVKHIHRSVPEWKGRILLFYGGMAFAYFVVFPLVFGFFTSAAPDGVAVMTDINSYLDFVLTLFMAFGLSFEIPVATVLLVLRPENLPESAVYGLDQYLMRGGAVIVAAALTLPWVVRSRLAR